MWKEFREFISRGSVMDLAVGIIIGTAFTAIINSLVNDIIMPLIGVILGGIDFTTLSVTIGSATINYGLFIQAIINFLIIALVVFFMVKGMNALYKKPAPKPAAPAAPPEDIQLLTQIRDLLEQQGGRPK